MLKKVVNLYKKAGETPLECINLYKNKNKELVNTPITYAGRLDPLAEGILIALIGDECLKREKYLSLEKEYELTILFGFATDTYDFMGKITSYVDFKNESIDFNNKIRGIISQFEGSINQAYPPYSSRTVKGKPLFIWARESKLNEIKIPSHMVLIKNIDIIDSGFIKKEEFSKKIKEEIRLVKGDFRQEEIINIWEGYLDSINKKEFPIITLRVTCGSGTYMRSIANDIGKLIGVPALALKIVRTRVGDYTI